MMGDNHVALLCMIYPASNDKQQRFLQLLRDGARGYYRRPSSKCTTWSYFLPLPQVGQSSTPLVIGGLEVYTEKNALQKQLEDVDFFQAFQKIVKKEQLQAKEDEMVAWYWADGFVAREQHAKPFGGTLVSVSRFIGDREKIMATLRPFAKFVKDTEPGVLTYAIFTRPKAPKEILLVGRYKDQKSLQSHGDAPEHVAAVEELIKHMENDIATTTSLWREVDDSFVSLVEGGPAESSRL